MPEKKWFLTLLFAMAGLQWSGGKTLADLMIPTMDAPVVVDFSTFAATGFSPSPTAGELDSTSWRAGGFSDGTLDYGATATTGDFARGRSSGGVRTGGLYAFEVAGGDYALGIQPTSGDFTPGFVELRILNQTGVAVPLWNVDYDVYFRNDSPRATSWEFSYSTDGSDFLSLPGLDFVTSQAADSTSFDSVSRTGVLPVTISDGGNLHFRWTSDDQLGTGARDEIALDNFRVVGTSATPEPASLTLMSVAALGLLGARRLRRVKKRQRKTHRK